MSTRVYGQVIFLVLLVALIILDTEPGWNIVLYLCFGTAAGMILLWSGAEIVMMNSWALYISLLAASLVGGALIKDHSGQVTRLLFLSAVLYIVGWVLIALVSLPSWISLVWTILGLVLFTLISVAVISRGKTMAQEESPIPVGVQIFLIQFNLFWLSALIWRLV